MNSFCKFKHKSFSNANYTILFCLELNDASWWSKSSCWHPYYSTELALVKIGAHHLGIIAQISGWCAAKINQAKRSVVGCLYCRSQYTCLLIYQLKWIYLRGFRIGLWTKSRTVPPKGFDKWWRYQYQQTLTKSFQTNF